MTPTFATSTAGIVLWSSTAAALEPRALPTNYAYPEPAWSPYLVGAAIGLLACATLALTKKRVSASSAYSDAVGLLGRAVAPGRTAALSYFQEHRPAIGWTMLFVVGTVLGSFVAAATGGELTGRYLQDLWVARFGPDSYALRTLMALFGGGLMAFGARTAGGCTSGHGISGALQLAVGSWVALVCFFIGGVATAMLLYLT